VPLNAETYGEMVIKHLTMTPPSPTDLRDLPQGIPGELEDLIMQCLEKNPNKRPQDMSEIVRRLELVGRAESMEHDALTLAKPQPKRYSTLMVLFVVFLVCAVGGFVAVGQLSGPRDRSQPAAEPTMQPENVGSLLPLEPTEPEKPQKIEVSFDSSPRGADVYRQGAAEPLGTTPFSASFVPASEPEVFEFKLKDHKTMQHQAALSENTTIAVTMAKVSKPPKVAKKKKKKRRKRKKKKKDEPEVKKPPGEEDASGTIDPFKDEE
jgi:hypothetical protein